MGISALQYIITLDKERMKWISVKNEFPKVKKELVSSKYVLIFDEIEGMWIADYHGKAGNSWYKKDVCEECDGQLFNVTHWMPLPEAP